MTSTLLEPTTADLAVPNTDHRDLLASVENKAGTPTISKYAYKYDAVGRRTSVSNEDTAFPKDDPGDPAGYFNLWRYNNRSELTGSWRGRGTTVPTDPPPSNEKTAERRAYTYDSIGNRKDATPATDPALYYCVNALNQYTATDDAANCSPPVTEGFAYDFDGNMTADGTRTFEWDGENRLTAIYPTTPSTNDKKVEFVYDYLGRRVRKTVSTYTSGQWVEDTAGDQLFVYDAWNVVMVLDANASNAITRKYTWGLDLSGALHGAGGIGGLLAVEETAATNSPAYWFLYDGNGNVGQVLKASDQSIAARYEYDAYGNTLVASGDYAAANPFRFSTKWLDTETGLYYYGGRYYLPRLGKWVNRDPIEEEGGLNLYAFVTNEPTNAIDYRGLWKIERKGEIWATVTSEKGDTIAALADELGLEKREYKLWLLDVHGSATTVPDRANGKVSAGCQYKTPNAVFIAYGALKSGELPRRGIHGSFRAEIDASKATWYASGFKVVEIQDAHKGDIEDILRRRSLYGFVYAGHGQKGNLTPQPSGGGKEGNPMVSEQLFRLSGEGLHKLNFMRLYACWSAETVAGATPKTALVANWAWNVSKKGQFLGLRGEPNKWGFQASKYVGPGQAGGPGGR